ncbi:MAG: LPS-assembly protein LptD [Rhizobiaceae bacterium]
MGGVRKNEEPLKSMAAVLAAATALACLFAATGPMAAQEQTVEDLAAQRVSPDSQLLLVADELIYDNNAQTVTASGNVQIDYSGNKLVAKKVIYDQKTGRLLAEGNVEIIEKDGNRIYAEKIDITDDFRDGFVNALRVETIDNTRFAAESAERTDGNVTTFNQGVYTACEPCKDRPEKAPIWQIKSRKIIWNQQKKTVRFEGGRFELFGLPLAFLPAFEIADPTVKRKTGFLIPGVRFKTELGYGVTVPFYVALAPNYDLLFNGTYYSKQGFLGEAEFRHRLKTGQYSVKVAGIRQNEPEAFRFGTVDNAEPNRAMIGTKGQFQINPRWTFGWDIMAQTDRNFSRTYSIAGFDEYYRKNEIYLTGIAGRNYLDLHGYRFNVQDDTNASTANSRQPWAGVADYSWTAPNPVIGGELNIDINARTIRRDEDSRGGANTNYVSNIYGGEGSSNRISMEAEWKRRITIPGGIAVSPILVLRGDGDLTDINDPAGIVRAEAFRSMATAGLDVRWPILFSTTSSSHILEPIAQIFARTNERFAGQLPNEDAQSFVFDAGNLLERDKFSGWDRIEGGTRANLALRYSGTFANGWTANALIGQSYHLSGVNSFASPDLVSVGAYSGLESDVSDFVAAAGLGTSTGWSLAARGRFDEKTFEVRRGEAELAYAGQPISASLRYAYIQAQPNYGFTVDRHEISGAASLKFKENWRAFGSATYDIENKYTPSMSVGFGYDDSCTSYSLTYSETRTLTTLDDPKRSIGFYLSFRTLGDFGTNQGIPQ